MKSIFQRNVAQLGSNDNGDYDGVVYIFVEFFSLCLRDGDVVEDVVDFGERDTADAN